jgi:ABC-type multidrug transport system fused ATPase/permease subunit
MSKQNPIFYLTRTGWQYAGTHRPLMIWYVVLFGLAQAVSLAEPYVIGQLLNSVQKNVSKGANLDRLVHDIYFYLLMFFLIQFFFWAFHGPGRLVERFVQFHIKANFKTSLFKMITDLPLQWHREHHSGDSIDKINRATNSLSSYFDMTFEVSYMLFRLIGTQIILFCFMPFAGWVALLTTAVSFAIIYYFDKVLSVQYFDLNKMDNRVASAVHDYVTNIVSVITLRLENPVLQEVNKRLFTSLKLYRKNSVINEVKWFLTTMLIGIMVVSVLLWYTHTTLGAGKVILSGTFFTLFEYLRRIGDSFYNFAYIYGSVVRQAADVQSAAPLIEAHQLLNLDAEKYNMPANWKQLEVNNLHFTYEDEKHKTHHLEDVSIKLARGSTVALVGESGSGKSTFLSLLRGVQTADDVTLICDGQVLPGKLAHLSHCTTLMPQDPEIFADTIKFNITFGFEASDEDVMKAVQIARFEYVLSRLPQGLETSIAEKGVNLSGGEKQRLALARGVYFARSSDVVLLDEPTSSVDTYNERQIYEAVLQTFADKCVVSSIHKLHLLEMFDTIYVFDDGRIVESGTFPELLASNGALSEMWKNYQISDNVLVTESCEIVQAII